MSRLEADNTGIKSVLKKIKTFLHRQSWEEVLIFFSFLLLSFGFWVLQSMNEEYEMEISIPVRYKDIPVDVAFSQPPPETIIVSVKDKGNILLNYTLGKKIAPLDVVYEQTQGKNGTLVVNQHEIESHIQKQLINTTQLQTFSPTRIEIKTSKRKEKKVPVTFNGLIIPKEGFGLAEKIAVSPATISIFSTQNILDSISGIRTKYIEVLNAKKTISRIIPLETIPGVTFSQSTISISIPIEEFTEKTLDIPVVCTGIPHNYIVRLFPPTIKVNCNIPLSKYKDLTDEDFSIRIKYEDLEQNLKGLYTIELEKKPDWIETFSMIPDRIEFIIEQAAVSYD